MNRFHSAIFLASLWLLASLAISCDFSEESTFPIIGLTTVNEQGDSVRHQINQFSFVDQRGEPFSEAQIKDKFVIADFFFTRCPDICPMMSKSLLRVEEAIEGVDDVIILSHSLDPQHDTPAELTRYINDLGAKGEKWYFLTTQDEDYVYEVMMDQYLLSGSPTGALNGGIFHTGKLVLIDRNGHIRGYYEGTDPLDVDRLIADIPRLRKLVNQEASR